MVGIESVMNSDQSGTNRSSPGIAKSISDVLIAITNTANGQSRSVICGTFLEPDSAIHVDIESTRFKLCKNIKNFENRTNSVEVTACLRFGSGFGPYTSFLEYVIIPYSTVMMMMDSRELLCFPRTPTIREVPLGGPLIQASSVQPRISDTENAEYQKNMTENVPAGHSIGLGLATMMLGR